jgi:hypothetical protein
MNIKEIVANLKDSNGKIADMVKVENAYIPLILKRSLVNSVCNMSLLLDDETKMLMSDNIMQELFATLFISLELSDLEIEGLFDDEGLISIEVALEAYDMLMQHNIYSHICKQLSNNDIEVLISCEIENRLELHNSIAAVLSRTLSSVINMLPSENKLMDAMKELPTMLNGLGNLEVLGGGKPKKAKK